MSKVLFHCAGHDETRTFKDGSTEDDVQEDFDIWLSERSDIGWSVVSGELKTEDEGNLIG